MASSGAKTEGSLDADVGLTAAVPLACAPSAWRAWLYLIWLSWQRQARARQMVWIALALLAFAVTFVAVQSLAGRWGYHRWRSPRWYGPTYVEWQEYLGRSRAGVPWSAGAGAVQDALLQTAHEVVERSGFFVFSSVLFNLFLRFLLPIWSLSFATEALGGEREGGNLVWLLTRPLSRPAIYLARFVALLPWSLGLNLGGFGLLCLAAGKPGALAFQLYWPAVFWSTLAFSALFLFMGAAFRRPAVVAILYSFFLETIFGDMPGYLKRASISFYTRCMMYEVGKPYHVEPESPMVYLPVDGATALWVLVGITVAFLLIGMAWFARTEYVTIE